MDTPLGFPLARAPMRRWLRLPVRLRPTRPRDWLAGVDPPFRRLLLASFLSAAGDRVHQVALVALIVGVTGSLAQAGLVFVVSTLPYLLFGLVTGALVDHYDRRRILVSMDVVRAVIVVVIPFAASVNLSLVYPLLFLLTCASLVFGPAEQASIPDLVNRAGLTRANSLNQVALYLADLIVYPLAAGLVTYLMLRFGPYRGTQFAFGLDSASYLASAILLCRLPLVKRHVAVARLTIVTLKEQVVAGLRYLWSNPQLRANTVLFVVGPLLLGSLNTLWIGFAYRVSHTDAWGYGMTESALAIGTMGGLWLLQPLSRRLNTGRVIAVGFVLMGTAALAVGFTDSLVLAAVLAVATGAGNMIFLVPSITMVQQHTADEMRGRVLGVRRMLTFTAFMVSNAAAGAMAERVGVSSLFLVLGAGMVGLAIVSLLSRTTREAI